MPKSRRRRRKPIELKRLTNIFVGHLISEDEGKVIISTQMLGDITILRLNIKSIRVIDPERMKNGQYWIENPHSTRYFFAPNAMGLKSGRGYYQNT